MTRVAVDVTPLVGVQTGIGRSVSRLLDGLADLERPPDVVRYAVGSPRHRSALPAGAALVPLPMRAALAAWSRTDRPSVDRWLGGAQVLHATNFAVPPSRLPTLVTVHDCSFALFPGTVAGHVHSFGPVLRRALRRGAHVHTATEQVAGEVEDLYAPGLRAQGRLHVVPFGVEPAHGRPGTPPVPDGPPYVLALGRIEPRKNLPVLVAAMAAVPGVRLVVAGPDGAGRRALDEAVAALAEPDRQRVLVLGPVDEDAKRALLHGALALAYPSLYEGFGFPVLEAMAAGTPVVAADIGALREVCGAAALLADPHDPEALADAVRRLAEDAELRTGLVDAGRERAASFTWRRTAEGLDGLYRRLAAQSSA
jgi:glycosyltransferase involved in cell wall biosynthesis